MNLLTINSFDCSAQTSGGVNQTTVALTTWFTRHADIRCFLGFFEEIPEGQEPLPLFHGRIRLSRHFDKEAFRRFLQDNEIDIVQVNFLKKHNLVVMPELYEVAHQCGARVIYAFHMCPGFQAHTYGSFERARYGWSHHDNALAETKKWLLTAAKPLWLPAANCLLRSKYRTPYDYADRVVVLSEHYFEPYLRLAGRPRTDKMVAIGNALRFSSFATPDDIAAKEKTLLVVARFDEDTNRISLVLRAWRHLQQDPLLAQWKLQLVGEGRDMPFYRYLVTRWHLQRVEFTGRQNPLEYYRRASLFLMTSTAEGWGMVLTEAMQMGVPVIAMDSFGALHDIVTDGVTGRIVPNNDLSAFEVAVREWATAPPRLAVRAAKAAGDAHRFEMTHTAAKWLELFNQLTNTSSPQ
ncbi:MAG: glycosyltransferase [Paludibacteraceae bacterium]|nr:glycosyltransferase [Paludibacteraceae bacterium]